MITHFICLNYPCDSGEEIFWKSPMQVCLSFVPSLAVFSRVLETELWFWKIIESEKKHLLMIVDRQIMIIIALTEFQVS